MKSTNSYSTELRNIIDDNTYGYVKKTVEYLFDYRPKHTREIVEKLSKIDEISSNEDSMELNKFVQKQFDLLSVCG